MLCKLHQDEYILLNSGKVKHFVLGRPNVGSLGTMLRREGKARKMKRKGEKYILLTR